MFDRYRHLFGMVALLLLLFVVSCVLLGGCASQLASQQCARFGYQRNTFEMSRCLDQQYNQNLQLQQQRAAPSIVVAPQ
jgi:cytochrome oxidase Cu insertion factor (SCO1/SenC/PrrC family)